MKKNRMMRLASGLLVAVLLSTCTISGTFAKYVTEDSASDAARVAKWGVTVLASGTLFGENYNGYSTDTTGNEISATVKNSVDTSISGENIVAPGTENDTGMVLSISGKPEVATNVTVANVYKDGQTDNKTVYLKRGTYGTLVKVANKVTEDNVGQYYVFNGNAYEKANTFESSKAYYELHDEVTVSADYYPVVFTWTEAGVTSGQTYTALTGENSLFSAINTYFSGQNSGQYPPNTDFNKSGVITWKWVFYKDASTDGADTILGNLQAQSEGQVVVKIVDDTISAISTEDYNLTVDFGVDITVTQVD